MNELEQIQFKFQSLGIEAKVFKNAIVVSLKAKPGSKVRKVKVEDSKLVLSFPSKAIEGEANKEIVKILSKLTGLASSQIELYKGAKSKLKKFILHYHFEASKTLDYYLTKINKGIN